jgi:methyl-accepting chemotaxis protein
MDGIARESREQASAIDQVNVAVRQLDEMTQHNAALVEETNAAIEQTEAQAVELDQIVGVFTIEEAARTVAAPRAAARSVAPVAKSNGVRSLQQRVSTAAKAYLTRGNAAVDTDKDWAEF